MLLFTGPLSHKSSPDAVIDRCLVTPLQQVQVPALEAGLIEFLEVKEGMFVETKQELARLDDQRAQLQILQAKYEWQAADGSAKNDVNIRYAEKSHSVAKMEYEMKLQAIEIEKHSVSKIEMEKFRLAAERTQLQIEQSKFERVVAQTTALGHDVKLRLAKNNLDRRKIEAPFQGMVVEVFKHVGEWVNPGDPVLRLLRMDRLKVEGFLDASKYGNEIADRLVTVSISLPRGRNEKFVGKSPEIEPVTNQFRVWAEVENRKSLLRPGAQAKMTIHIKDSLDLH